ncbi:hypothetical protein OG234_13565 [Streptomyces sp. NBC_01420]|uniref:hypothetical protein n=1 Tax=Streptomyces sp. NBC_01420 TaxID=2903858 RepID=UPI0032483AC5
MIGPKALAPLMDAIVGRALIGSPEEVAGLLDVVLENGDDADTFGVCVVLAELGRVPLQQLFPDAGVGPDTEWCVPPFAVELLAGDPHGLFAVRFLTAHLNGDTDMCAALLRATELGTQDRQESVCALLAHVRGLNHWATWPPPTALPGGTT